MENNEKNIKLKYIIVGGIISLLLVALFTYLSYNRFKDYLIDVTVKESLHFFLFDGFSFAFLLYFCFYLFAYISYKEHFFAMLKYAFKKYGTALLPRKLKINNSLPRTYGDYLEEERAKPVPYYRWLLWDSLICLFGAIICGILYALNPIQVAIA